MSIKKRLRSALLCLVLGMGSLIGAPMRPEEIEDLMHAMNQPKVARVLPDESDHGDDR